MALAAISAGAETPLVYEGTVSGNAGSGDFAPSYMMSGNGGVLTQPKAFSLQLKAEKELDLSRRFSYAFGVEGIAGHASAFEQYDQAPQAPAAQGQHPTSVWLQQLYRLWLF